MKCALSLSPRRQQRDVRLTQHRFKVSRALYRLPLHRPAPRRMQPPLQLPQPDPGTTLLAPRLMMRSVAAMQASTGRVSVCGRATTNRPPPPSPTRTTRRTAGEPTPGPRRVRRYAGTPFHTMKQVPPPSARSSDGVLAFGMPLPADPAGHRPATPGCWRTRHAAAKRLPPLPTGTALTSPLAPHREAARRVTTRSRHPSKLYL